MAQYRPFVLKTAKRFKTSGVAQEDLVQEGLIAVAIAFRTWRQDGGSNFLTWIHRPVYYAMLKLAREQQRMGGTFRGAGRGFRKGERNAARFISLDSGGAVEYSESHFLLQAVNARDAARSLHEKIGSFEEPADPFLHGELPNLVSGLEKRQRQVLRLRFEKGLTYAEVGARLKISRELARQIEQKALETLKERMLNGEKRES